MLCQKKKEHTSKTRKAENKSKQKAKSMPSIALITIIIIIIMMMMTTMMTTLVTMCLELIVVVNVLLTFFFCPLRSCHDTSGNFTNATLVDFFLLLTVMMLIAGTNTILLLVISVLPYLICISTLRSRRVIGCS